ncbi:MAG TPA: TIGR02996 domain-containing protein [Gemmataceae bacterium]|jgi:uncharacterized protein (TIGR02996 family)
MAQSHADAFLEAILQDPDDDTPRLIFADWLEEQGDSRSAARAELIRVQCMLADGPLSPRRRIESARRQQEILEEFSDEWTRPLHDLVRNWNFHRGFIDEVALWSETFLACADRLFRQAPIQHMRLWTHFVPVGVQQLSVAALADCEHLRRLRSLDLNANRLESRDVRALVVSEHLTRLTALSLAYNRIGDSGIRALAGSPLLGRLEHLNLRGNDVGPGGLRVLTHALEELARAPEGLCLRRLELSFHNLSAAGQRVIADSPLLRRLTRV